MLDDVLLGVGGFPHSHLLLCMFHIFSHSTCGQRCSPFWQYDEKKSDQAILLDDTGKWFWGKKERASIFIQVWNWTGGRSRTMFFLMVRVRIGIGKRRFLVNLLTVQIKNNFFSHVYPDQLCLL